MFYKFENYDIIYSIKEYRIGWCSIMDNKPAYLLPFIYTYRFVRLVLLGFSFILYNIGNGFNYVLNFAAENASIIAIGLCYLIIAFSIGTKIWFTTIFVPQSGFVGVAIIWLFELLVATIGTMSVGLYFFVTNIRAYLKEKNQNKRIQQMENEKKFAREKQREENADLPFIPIPIVNENINELSIIENNIDLPNSTIEEVSVPEESVVDNPVVEPIVEDLIEPIDAVEPSKNEQKGFFSKLFAKKEELVDDVLAETDFPAVDSIIEPIVDEPISAYETQNADVLVVPNEPIPDVSEEPVILNVGNNETVAVTAGMGMADFVQKQQIEREKAERERVELERLEHEKLLKEKEEAIRLLAQEDEKNKQIAIEVEQKRLALEEKEKLKLEELERRENERLEKIRLKEEAKEKARAANEERNRLKQEEAERRRLEKEEKKKINDASVAEQKASQEEKNKIKQEIAAQKQAQKEERWRIKAELKKQKAAAKKQKEDMLALKRAEELELKNKRAKEAKSAYVNEAVHIDKKSFGDKLNDSFKEFTKSPDKIKKYFSDKVKNSTFVKNANNRAAMERESLLINFEGADAIKSEKKLLYEYVAKMPNGRVIKGYFDAYSKVEVHSYLLSEGYEVYSIRTSKWIQFLYGRSKVTGAKIKTADLIFFLTQLSTYIKAGIPLVEALKILSRQFKNKNYKRIFEALIYDLTMGDNLSDAMTKQGEAFPKLLINMVKAAEMTGELPESLDNMSEYYTEIDRTRRQMITAMMYPSIVFVISIAVITFIMLFVIPKFVEIYESMDNAAIPDFTLFVLGVSNFFQKNILWLGIGLVVVILLFSYLYKNVKIFKTIIQYLAMKTPIFGEVIIYNEVTMFTKTFASLLSHNVFITDSMDILNRLTNNEIYKTMILDTITNLARGEKISTAFADHWAFPIPAYEMIVTGEKTGQLAEMMDKVSQYYQELHRNAVGRIKAFVEPALIIFLTAIVGVIVLAIVIPMFNMYSAIQA